MKNVTAFQEDLGLVDPEEAKWWKRVVDLASAEPGNPREELRELDEIVILPASHYVQPKERMLEAKSATFKRIPYFCSGCPHNTSTRVPEGSRAVAGIGCHYMAVWMDRSTVTFSQMGGEGVEFGEKIAEVHAG